MSDKYSDLFENVRKNIEQRIFLSQISLKKLCLKIATQSFRQWIGQLRYIIFITSGLEVLFLCLKLSGLCFLQFYFLWFYSPFLLIRNFYAELRRFLMISRLFMSHLAILPDMLLLSLT